MRYLIDGYNLLHAMGLLCGKVGPHGLEKARRAVLGRLCGCHGDNASDVTIVFDASRAPPGAAGEEDYHGIHVRFALDREADEVIEALIQREAMPRQLTIVSDDHRIRQAGRRRRCLVSGCLDYLEEIERKRYKPAVSQAAVKPEGISSDETQCWLREFADLTNDPSWTEALGPNFAEADQPKSTQRH
jgi:uncharacterized protein